MVSKLRSNRKMAGLMSGQKLIIAQDIRYTTVKQCDKKWCILLQYCVNLQIFIIPRHWTEKLHFLSISYTSPCLKQKSDRFIIHYHQYNIHDWTSKTTTNVTTDSNV